MAATFPTEILDEVSQEPRPGTEDLLLYTIDNGICRLAINHSIPMRAISIETESNRKKLVISVNSDSSTSSSQGIIQILGEDSVTIVRKKKELVVISGPEKFLGALIPQIKHVLKGYFRDHELDEIEFKLVKFLHPFLPETRKHHQN